MLDTLGSQGSYQLMRLDLDDITDLYSVESNVGHFGVSGKLSVDAS